jgi:hypothetical protein
MFAGAIASTSLALVQMRNAKHWQLNQFELKTNTSL